MLVLLVEDDATTLALLTMRLNEMGHGVEVAADAQTAFTKMAERAYPFVLLDYHFREGPDGLALLRAVRAAGYRGDVLMMTAMDGNELEALRRDAAALGSQVLAKPFNMNNLAVHMGRATEAKT